MLAAKALVARAGLELSSAKVADIAPGTPLPLKAPYASAALDVSNSLDSGHAMRLAPSASSNTRPRWASSRPRWPVGWGQAPINAALAAAPAAPPGPERAAH